MDKEVETQPATDPAPITDAEAEAAFAEGAGEPAPQTPGIPPAPDAPPRSQDQPGTSAVDQKMAKGKNKDQDDSPKKPSYEELEHQVRENKAWGTRTAMELAELRRKAVEKQTPPAAATQAIPPSQGQKAPEYPQAVKDYLLDYPDVEQTIKAILSTHGQEDTVELKAKIADLEKRIEQTQQNLQDQAIFERSIVNGYRDPMTHDWVDGHPDAYKVMASADFANWFDSERKIDPAVGNVADPRQAIGIINRYKTQKAQQASAAYDPKKTPAAAAVIDMMTGAVPAGNNVPDRHPQKKDESPESIFNQFAT